MACFEYYAGLGEKLDSSREKDVDVGDSSFRYILYLSLSHIVLCIIRPLPPKLLPGHTLQGSDSAAYIGLFCNRSL